MFKDIKTREISKDIKTVDKQSALKQSLRETTVHTKEEVQNSAEPANSTAKHNNPEGYATDKVEQYGKETASKTAKTASKAKDIVKERHQASNTAKQLVRQAQAKGQVKQLAQRAGRNTAIQNAQATIKTAKHSGEAAGRTAKAGAKTTGHTVKATTKTTDRAAKTTIKTAKSSTQAAKKTAHSAQIAAKATARATAKAAQTARISAKAAHAAARTTLRAVTAFAKMAIAATKSLITALAAGGWVAVAAILIICMVGLIATSAFGIFYAGGDMGDANPTLREVITQVNQEHQAKVDEAKQATAHDDVIITGAKAPWKEVLAVYAVKATTNPDNPTDAITLDEHRQQLLREVFWDMNKIESRAEQRQSYIVTLVEEANGVLTEKTETVTVTTLFITFTALSAEEAADLYHFTNQQRVQLKELLSSQYDSMWQAVLYGTHNGSASIVEVAAAEIGNTGGQPYWSWYGFGSRVEWCACFVSWCANECGYIDAGLIPKFAGCEWQGEAWFKARGQWQEPGYAPKPGDIIFFDWDGAGSAGVSDHVGIVESVDGSTIYTIEGNSSDAVRRLSYHINSSSIAGFGTPDYR